MATPRILIVAGSDSSGGAGIQADIKTVTMLGGHAMTAITALTAQNTLGVTGVMPVPAEFVLEQIDAVAEDIGVDAVKIGMIGSPETAHAVADRLERMSAPIVFDPVMVATSGSVLADEATIAAFERLMRLASVVTPNLPELEALTGEEIGDDEARTDAAAALSQRLGCAVLAKGGHAPGDRIVDILVTEEGVQEHFAERIDTRHTHGTGCTLASGIATELGRGRELADAVPRARAYLLAALGAAPGLGAGHGPIGHALGTVPFDSIHRKSS
ncbi:MAG: bifunctional hydroxymethylpyrimidine kinase/phosphomethylpyrimidine kinase [Pseudomonadota bacterium]|nr:bifunctional hydroxymethylpyrimidine kinase/phosphomethylpyrimidine kinase [Pseudomonadota bacterium]